MLQNTVRFAAKRSANSYKTLRKIIIKIYLSENKEVTLFVQLNW